MPGHWGPDGGDELRRGAAFTVTGELATELRGPSVTEDHLAMTYCHDEGSGYRLSETVRAADTAAFPVGAAIVAASPMDEAASWPGVSRDGLEVFFMYATDDESDVYVMTRPDRGSPFGDRQPVPTAALASVLEGDPALSGDGRTLYFNIFDAVGSAGEIYALERRCE